MFSTTAIIIGCIIFTVAICGIFLNILVLKFTKRVVAFQSCFGALVRFEAASAFVFNCIFALYVAPSLLFKIEVLQQRAVSARFGQLAVLSHDVCTLCHLVISFNRFLAAFCSSRYTSIFTVKKTHLYSGLIVVIGFALTPFNFFEECWFFFDFEYAAFTYDLSTTCGKTVAFYVQFPRNVAIMVVCTLLNIATYFKIRIINKKSMTALAATVEHLRRHKLELALISQVCVQATVYIIQFFTYFLISPLFLDYPWVTFFMTTFAWQMIHVTDGLVVFAFNKDLRKIVIGGRKSKVTSITFPSRPNMSISLKL